MSKPTRLDQILQELQKSQTWRKPQEFLAIVEVWTQVAGTQVAKHSQPVRVQNGILWIATSSAVWAQQLTYQRDLLRQKLSQALPDLHLVELRFSTSGWQTKKTIGTATTTKSSAMKRKSFRWPPTEDVQERFGQVSQVLRWRREQSPPCPRCHQVSHPASLQRWGYCAACHRDTLGTT